MPEATEDAVFLFATSYQALGRASHGSDETMTCNCTVVIVFAAFFIEANLTHIIEKMGDAKKIKNFSGLYPRISWFYNKYVKKSGTIERKDNNKSEFQQEVFDYFPGLEEIKKFRNDVAHGKINRSKTNIDNTVRLRAQAKEIVNQLFDIASNNGHDIQRAITYQMAVSSNIDHEDN